jgi:hypothetical protein
MHVIMHEDVGLVLTPILLLKQLNNTGARPLRPEAAVEAGMNKMDLTCCCIITQSIVTQIPHKPQVSHPWVLRQRLKQACQGQEASQIHPDGPAAPGAALTLAQAQPGSSSSSLSSRGLAGCCQSRCVERERLGF